MQLTEHELPGGSHRECDRSHTSLSYLEGSSGDGVTFAFRHQCNFAVLYNFGFLVTDRGFFFHVLLNVHEAFAVTHGGIGNVRVADNLLDRTLCRDEVQ